MKNPVVRNVAIFSVIVVVLAALWGMWYIGGNASDNGKQWCSIHRPTALVHCAATETRCDNSRGSNDTVCGEINKSQLFYCGHVENYFGCFINNPRFCNDVATNCRQMTYGQAREIMSRTNY